MNNHSKRYLLFSLLIGGSLLGMQENVKRQPEEESTESSKKARTEAIEVDEKARAESSEKACTEAIEKALNTETNSPAITVTNPHELDAERRTPLHNAAIAGDVVAIQRLVQLGAKLEDIDKHGKTPLAYAAFHDHPAAIRCLIQLGADRDASAGWPFALALTHNKLDAMRVLFELGAQAFPPGWTWLHRAAAEGHANAIPLLIELGIPVNETIEVPSTCMPSHLARLHQLTFGYRYNRPADETSIGNTPLHCVRSVDVMKCLVQVGANIEARNNLGLTPLHRCIHSKEKIKYLVSVGADINATDHLGQTPLHLAVLVKNSDPKQYFDAIQCLIELGANKELRDNQGRTPLLCAVDGHTGAGNQVGLISLLVKLGCEREIKDQSGNTPINRILLQNPPGMHPAEQRDMIYRLYLLGADVSDFCKRASDHQAAVNIRELEIALNSGDATVLQQLFFRYASEGATDLVRKLFTDLRSKDKVDLNAFSEKGNTALMISFQSLHLAVGKLLFYKYKASFTIKGPDGRTVKDLVNKRGSKATLLRPLFQLFERKVVAALALTQTKTRPNNPLPKELAFKIVRMIS